MGSVLGRKSGRGAVSARDTAHFNFFHLLASRTWVTAASVNDRLSLVTPVLGLEGPRLTCRVSLGKLTQVFSSVK